MNTREFEMTEDERILLDRLHKFVALVCSTPTDVETLTKLLTRLTRPIQEQGAPTLTDEERAFLLSPDIVGPVHYRGSTADRNIAHLRAIIHRLAPKDLPTQEKADG